MGTWRKTVVTYRVPTRDLNHERLTAMVTTSVLTATLPGAPPPDNHPMTYGRAVTALNMVRKFFGNVQKYNLFLKKKSLFLDFFASSLTATFPEFTELCL